MEGPLAESPTTHRARVVWEGDKRDLRAHRIEIGGVTVPGSCSPSWGGDPERTDPEDMFVAALASCHMLWFLALARGRRLRVLSYEDAATGELDHEAYRFIAVRLRPSVSFREEPDVGVLDELHKQAHRRCFIANSVSCPVTVEPSIQLTDPPPGGLE